MESVVIQRASVEMESPTNGIAVNPSSDQSGVRGRSALSSSNSSSNNGLTNGGGGTNDPVYPPSPKAAASNPSAAPSDAPLTVMSYKTPKNTLLSVIKAGMAKGNLSMWKVFVMGIMAGMYIGVGALLSVMVAGGSKGLRTTDPGLVKLYSAAVFPLGILLVVIAGGELFTGNVMFIGVSLLAKKSTFKQLAINWIVSWVGNFVGALIVAYFLAYLPEILHTGDYRQYLTDLTYTKINYGWGVSFLRAVGCNWLVCAALFFALASDELAAKILALWWPVTAFVALGYEHCVANMMTLPLGLMEGSAASIGQLFYKNLIPVTLGNIVGGFVFVGLVEWVVYSDYFGEKITNLGLSQGYKPNKGRVLVPVILSSAPSAAGDQSNDKRAL